MPKVSVIIPSRDRPAMLREAVESVVAQTHKDIEIIVVLTGANDATKQSAAELQSEHGVRIVETAPLSLAATRNNGLAVATGEWVSFLDDDDLWLPAKLEKQIAAALSENADVVTTNWRRFNSSGHVENWMPAETLPWPTNLSIAEALMVKNFVSVGSLVRTTAIKQMGGFDVAFPACEDWDMWRRLSHGHKIAYLDEYLMLVRMHDRNMSGNQWLMYLASIQHMAKMRRDTPPHLRHMLFRQWKTVCFLTAFFAYELANRTSAGKTRAIWRRIKLRSESATPSN